MTYWCGQNDRRIIIFNEVNREMGTGKTEIRSPQAL